MATGDYAIQDNPMAGLYGTLLNASYGWDLTPQEWDWLDNIKNAYGAAGGSGMSAAEQKLFGDDKSGLWYSSQTPAPDYEVNVFKQLGGLYENAPAAETEAYQGFKNLIGKGYTPDEFNAMKVSALEGSQAQADAARNAMLMNAKRTGNDAGVYGAMARASQSAANAPADTIRNLEIQNAALRNQNTVTGLGGLQNSAQQTIGRQMGALGSQAQMAQNVGQRSLEAYNQAAALAQNAAARQQGYANLGVGLTNALRQNRQFGTTGLQNLYNTQAANTSDLYSKLATLLGTRTADYTDLTKRTQGIQLY